MTEKGIFRLFTISSKLAQEKKFLLFPKTIGDERRWLEFARIRQVCQPLPEYYDNAGDLWWFDVEWAD